MKRIIVKHFAALTSVVQLCHHHNGIFLHFLVCLVHNCNNGYPLNLESGAMAKVYTQNYHSFILPQYYINSCGHGIYSITILLCSYVQVMARVYTVSTELPYFHAIYKTVPPYRLWPQISGYLQNYCTSMVQQSYRTWPSFCSITILPSTAPIVGQSIHSFYSFTILPSTAPIVGQSIHSFYSITILPSTAPTGHGQRIHSFYSITIFPSTAPIVGQSIHSF